MRPSLILDVDGTVWRCGEPLPGAVQALAELRRLGLPILFLSNNPVPAAEYAERMNRLGVPAAPAEVLTCLTLLEAELAGVPGAPLYVVADDRLQARLAEHHPVADDPAAIEIVLASGPYDLTYQRLNVAFQALRRGAAFWATNADPSVLAGAGGEVPHTAAVIGALQACTGRRLDRLTGKPSLLSAWAALERLGCGPEQALVVGDGLETDIALGRNAGMRTVLVLSGVTRQDDLTDPSTRPDYVLDSLAALPELLGRLEGG
jgi:NagD protein